MKKKIGAQLLPMALAAATLAGASAAWADGAEWHGYFRTQVGSTSKGGNLQCFDPGWPNQSKFRLGNECDDYGEANLALPFGDANGVWGKYHISMSYQPNNANGDYSSVNSNNLQFANRENYFEAGGFFDRGALEDAKLWVGARYYNRHDIHINDYYYWSNSGRGAGIEEIKLGSAKAAFAYFQSGDNGLPTSANNVKRYAARLYDINVNQGGKLEGELVSFSGSTAGTGSTGTGQVLFLQHSQSDVLGGNNNLALVVGNGLGGNGLAWSPTYVTDGSGSPGNSSGSSARLSDGFYFDLKNNWTGMLSASVGNLDQNGSKINYYNIGVRPQYNFSATRSIAVELSHTEGSNSTSRPSMDKLTVAPQLTLSGGFWARPVLRAFVTYARWNDDAKANGIANGVFGNDNQGLTWGFQAEAWW